MSQGADNGYGDKLVWGFISYLFIFNIFPLLVFVYLLILILKHQILVSAGGGITELATSGSVKMKMDQLPSVSWHIFLKGVTLPPSFHFAQQVLFFRN